jgi:sugar phosphate isomerase/epimerase
MWLDAKGYIMIFNEPGGYGYNNSMDREYISNASPEFVSGYSGGTNLSDPLFPPQKEPILTTGQIGQTVGEGRGSGSFIESMQAAIRKGVKSVELSMSASGSEPNVGPDLYGRQKRREIKEIAKGNQVEITSVHVPVQVVSNMAGFAGNERGFMDEQRHLQLTEVKKAIDFAADTTNGGAIVIHTGEFQRPFSEQPWARNEHGEMRFYEEEPERFTAYLVDDRTGRTIGEAKKTQAVYEPIYRTAVDVDLVGKKDPVTGRVFEEHDWVDMHNHWINPDDQNKLFDRVPQWNSDYTKFDTVRLTWDDFEERAERWNKDHAAEIAQDSDAKKTAEEMFWKTQMENRALQMKGSSLFHGQYYERHKREYETLKKSLEYYKKLEAEMPEDEVWKIMIEDPIVRRDIAPSEWKRPSEVIERDLDQARHHMRYTHEASASADAQADTTLEDLKHVKAISKYAKEQTSKSYAEAGIHAMDTTRDRELDKPIFLAPENIFPEHGYGSHPEELVELVQTARERMVEFLSKQEIDGKPNRFYRGMSEAEAKKKAAQHIQATIDTEHLGMWKKHFMRNSGETEEAFDKRFNTWYMDEVKKMEKAGVIGHLHIADGFGYGHANLPAGHGTMPVVDAVSYLKKKGYKGAYLSEGYGDATRMLRDTWKTFGSPIYSAAGPVSPGGPSRQWTDVQHGYFGRDTPPNYIFGSYSPSNDWTLWSQSPLE